MLMDINPLVKKGDGLNSYTSSMMVEAAAEFKRLSKCTVLLDHKIHRINRCKQRTYLCMKMKKK